MLLRSSSLFVAALASVVALHAGADGAAATSLRNKLRQPFSSRSPWNTPVGSLARYVPAGFEPGEWVSVDEEFFFVLKASDPMQPVFRPLSWEQRCSGTDDQGLQLPLPDDLIVPDANPPHTPNNCAAFLMPDGRTIVQVNPFTRCVPGGPAYGWQAPTERIDGLGIRGGHGGSELSCIGGTLRVGELASPDPIRHVLKVNIWGKKYLTLDALGRGYRWPASRHDAYANDPDRGYHGTNQALKMGSLLAIPRHVTADSLGLTTPAAKKLFWTLQNYGAYIVDDTAWNVHALCVEHGVKEEFEHTYGYPMECQNGQWFNDFNALFSVLAVIDNNGPKSVGGSTLQLFKKK